MIKRGIYLYSAPSYKKNVRTVNDPHYILSPSKHDASYYIKIIK